MGPIFGPEKCLNGNELEYLVVLAIDFGIFQHVDISQWINYFRNFQTFQIV